jgi:replicative DNA helicase
MEYRELVKIVLGRFFNPLQENDQEDIVKNLRTKDLLNQFNKQLFKFGKDKYNSRGKIPKINELAVQPKIALRVVNSSKDILDMVGRKEKFKLDEIKELVEFSGSEEEISSAQMIVGEIKEVLNRKFGYNEKIYNQEIIYYIEKLKNARKIKKAKHELAMAKLNLEEMERKGEEFQSNKVFQNGLNSFLPENTVDSRTIKDIVEEGRKKEAEGNRIPTFIPTIDREYRIGGISRGEMGTIAADTGVGKTFFGMVMFYNQIINGHNVYYLTLEEDKDEIIQRLLSIHSNLVPEYRKLNIESDEWEGKGYFSNRKEKLDEIVDDMMQYNFAEHIIDVSGDTSYYNIKQQLINLSMGKDKAELIYIDYLQMVSIGNSNSVAADFREVSKELLSFARSNKIAIIGLAQLKMLDEKPKKSDIRWSKSFANNSHFVYLLHREGYGLSEEELKEKGLNHNQKLELMIEKNRGTGKGFGMVPLFFDQEYGYIQEYSNRHEEQATKAELESVKQLEEEGTKSYTLEEMGEKIKKEKEENNQNFQAIAEEYEKEKNEEGIKAKTLSEIKEELKNEEDNNADDFDFDDIDLEDIEEFQIDSQDLQDLQL